MAERMKTAAATTLMPSNSLLPFPRAQAPLYYNSSMQDAQVAGRGLSSSDVRERSVAPAPPATCILQPPKPQRLFTGDTR
jgi:hypothetical protein